MIWNVHYAVERTRRVDGFYEGSVTGWHKIEAPILTIVEVIIAQRVAEMNQGDSVCEYREKINEVRREEGS